MWDIFVEMPHHIEDGVGRFCEMGEYKCVCVAVLGDAPEESPFNVGTYTHLSGFKD